MALTRCWYSRVATARRRGPISSTSYIHTEREDRGLEASSTGLSHVCIYKIYIFTSMCVCSVSCAPCLWSVEEWYECLLWYGQQTQVGPPCRRLALDKPMPQDRERGGLVWLEHGKAAAVCQEKLGGCLGGHKRFLARTEEGCPLWHVFVSVMCLCL